jgi:hypothetical protein
MTDISWPDQVPRRLARLPQFDDKGEAVPLGFSLRPSEVAYLRE